MIIGLKEEGKTFDELKDTLRIIGALNELNPFESITFENGETIEVESIALQSSAPILDDISKNILEDTSISENLNVGNPSGGVLNYEILTSTTNGEFTLDSNGVYSYIPNQDYNGEDTAIIKVTNEYGLSATSTLTFEIEAVNDAPVAIDGMESLNEDEVLNGILPIASDVDGDVLTYNLVSSASHGQVSLNSDGHYTYTPNSNYYGADYFSYIVDDGNSGETIATIDLVVNSVIDNMIIYGTNIGDILNGDQIDIGSNDTIYGLGGDDTIYGLDGNDTIDGGIGNDHLDGGSGIDTISYESENNPVTVDLATSIQYNYYSGIDYISNFENIKGSNYDDMLVGDNSNNVLSGLIGNDLIMAGNGNDTLIGGEGEDLLWGEAGSDNFVLSISGNGDTILDFSHGEDHIYLNKTIFTSLTENGVLNSDFFVANDTGKATDGNDYIAYNIYTGELFYDADGNGPTAAVKIATMHGLSSYTDFVVI